MYRQTNELTLKAVKIIHKLQEACKGKTEPLVFLLSKKYGKDPFVILISCLLSLRTKDTTTYPASLRLFERAKTPTELLNIPVLEIETLIYPVGFYRKKAALLHTISRELLEKFHGQVPNTLETLLALPGVGRKTANLVLGEGFGVPAICVDTHVHRISNRLGLVQTKTPEETERALKEILPKEYWIDYNRLLVTWGQTICVPISPFCSRCAINELCPKIGVTTSR